MVSVIALLILASGLAIAQTTPAESTQEQVTDESLKEARKALESDQTLDADARKSATEQLDGIPESLRTVARHQQALQALQQDAKGAVEEQQRIERILATALPEFSGEAPADTTREELQADVTLSLIHI